MSLNSAYHVAKRFALGLVAKLLFLFQVLGGRSLPASLDELPYDAPLRPIVPTYDGSGQAVHPDVMELAGGSPRFLLAMTPYTYTDDYLENPSLLVSDDGLRFREERKGLNPLAPPPPFDHNDDPDLSLSGGTYTILYLETLRPERQNLVRLRSEDRLSWRRDVIASHSLGGSVRDPLIVSPALAVSGSRNFLYYVNTSSSPYRIEYLESGSAEVWDQKDARLPSFDRLPFVPWHLDIVKGSGEYYMLLTEVHPTVTGRGFDLYLARSPDLVHWSLGPRLFDKPPFDAKDIYRSSALVRGGDIFVYFSYESRSGAWRIGLVRKKIATLFAPASGQ
jgi:hypothetical protein